MGIGVGIVLVVIGLVLILGVFPDIPQVDDITLGWILLVVGALGIVLVLIMNAQRSRTTITERRAPDDRIR
jgi:Domain of unknown function (DUF6458)